MPGSIAGCKDGGETPLPLMLTPTRLAVGLEPLNVPGAAGAVSPNPFNGIIGSPAGLNGSGH